MCTEKIQYPEEWYTLTFREAVEKVRDSGHYHWQAGRADSLRKFAIQRYRRDEPQELRHRVEALMDLYYKMTPPLVTIRSRETGRPVGRKVCLKPNREDVSGSVPTSEAQVSWTDSAPGQVEEPLLPKGTSWADWSDEEPPRGEPATGSSDIPLQDCLLYTSPSPRDRG